MTFHNMSEQYINLDYFANTSKDRELFDQASQILNISTFNPHSDHTLGQRSLKEYDDSMKIIKRIFPFYKNIEFIHGGGTIANKRAFYNNGKVTYCRKYGEDDIIMVSSIEHSSITKHIVRALHDRKYTIVFIPVNNNGIIDINQFQQLLEKYQKRIIMISCMIVNNEIGTIQPICQMIELSKKYIPDVIFHSDCGAGMYLLKSMQPLPDIVTCSVYKFGGPHCGLLMSNISMIDEYDGTIDVFTVKYASLVIDKYFTNIDIINQNNVQFKQKMIDQIKLQFDENKISYVLFENDTVPNVISMIIPELKASYIQKELSKRNIFIGSGSACTTNEGSNTLKEMGYNDDISQRLIRLSYTNNTYDVNQIINEITNIIIENKHLGRNIACNLRKTKTKELKSGIRHKPTIDIDLKTQYENIYVNGFILSYAELVLRGGNKQSYIDIMKNNITRKLKTNNIVAKVIYNENSSILLTDKLLNNSDEYNKIVKSVCEIAGLSVISAITIIENDLTKICTMIASHYNAIRQNINDVTFCVSGSIGKQKILEMSETEWKYYIGEYLKQRFNDKVDLKNPKITINIGYYRNLKSNDHNLCIVINKYNGIGGLPSGSEGEILFYISPNNYNKTIYSITCSIKRGIIPVIVSENDDILQQVKKYIDPLCHKNSLHTINTFDDVKTIITNKSINMMIYENGSKQNFYTSINQLKKIGNDLNVYATSTTLLNCNSVCNDSSIFSDVQCDINPYGLMLISGGIDSPVVGKMLVDEKIEHDYIHYMTDVTNLTSKNKIINIVRTINNNQKTIHFVDFGELQNLIAKECKECYRVMMYKIFMILIPQIKLKQNGYNFLAMGSAIGQVASQTKHNLYVTDKFSEWPIYCPLLFCNKNEIIEMARNNGTYEQSICDGNDCCVQYLPKNPVLNASIDYIKTAIKKFVVLDDNQNIIDIIGIKIITENFI